MKTNDEPSARGRRWELVLAVAAAVAAIVVIVVAIYATDDAPNASAERRPTAPTTTTAAPAGVPYDLYTHCGIYEARVGDTYFVADTPLDDGYRNPPAGWGNPTQHGTITRPSPGVAIFRDELGHVVRFHARPGATGFLRLCM